MGNSNTSIKKKHYSRGQYASQFSLNDILGGRCIGTPEYDSEPYRPWSRISRRSWSVGTLNDPFNVSKTAWPVPRFEAIFLPEFTVREEPLKNEYKFLDIISNGAYGRVFKVLKNKVDEIYALKAISKAKIVAENAIYQAKQEVSIQRAVGHHPFIVKASHHWQGRKTLYILTDFVGGGELFSLVEEFGCLPENVVRIYVAEIALAIDFLHNAGIIHRDIKATNVLLNDEGHAILIDFGLSKWLRPTHRTGTFCGTLEYMAPEILKREYYGHEVDWWSLGVLACFLLLNEYPIIRIVDDPIEEGMKSSSVNLPSNVENISAGGKDLLKRLLNPNPRMRLKSILALQRIAFFMSCDIQSYTLKQVSPFRLLGKETVQSSGMHLEKDEFYDFDSIIAGSTNRTWTSSSR